MKFNTLIAITKPFAGQQLLKYFINLFWLIQLIEHLSFQVYLNYAQTLRWQVLRVRWLDENDDISSKRLRKGH